MKKLFITLVSLSLVLSGCVATPTPRPAQPEPNQPTPSQTVCTQDAKLCPDGSYVSRTGPNCEFAPCPVAKPVGDLVAPTTDFRIRVTKKFFGTYVTPQNSPVSPEKFTGYHTGIDIEYGDVTTDVEVHAIAAGKVERSGFVSGYGGMIAVRSTINGKNDLVIYGHLKPSSLLAKDSPVNAGQVLGVLGKGYSTETDGERKHLHLAIYTGADTNVAGYVQVKSKLSAWIDPLTILP